MCGIVGYIGARNAIDILIGGLKRLEYRGYDSAGVAVLGAQGLEVCRSVGKISQLEACVLPRRLRASVGLGHTRWATHGRPCEANAHPHLDCSGRVAVVHNGILENYAALKTRLEAEGHRFTSETDTEVLAHLIEHHQQREVALEEAVTRAIREIRGSYAIAVLSTTAPDRLVAAKQGAGSVVIGLGSGEMFLASDIPAILPHTRDVVILEDGEVAVLTRDGHALSTFDGRSVRRSPTRIAWDPIMAEKGGYPHFMLKEIYEQPRAVADTVRGRVDLESGTVNLGDAALDPLLVRRIRRVVVIACGTSFHAGLVARHLIERLSGLPVEADLASEFRYRDAPLDSRTLVVAISQSGETADTLAAVKVARARGSTVLAITNVVGSALSREASSVLYTHAGPEIGVASTKTFTAAVAAGYLLALALGLARGALTAQEGRKRILDLLEVPQFMEAALGLDADMAEVAQELVGHESSLYLGRGIQHPIALEGALKLKELSYRHAEGYAAGEMKHGPIALIHGGLPIVALVPRDQTYDRMLGTLQEVRARDGRIIAIAYAGDREISTLAHRVIGVPSIEDLLSPLLTILPLQFLAYHVAVQRGCDVDQPRNLAKSVTVE